LRKIGTSAVLKKAEQMKTPFIQLWSMMRTLMTRRDRASQEDEGRRKTWVFPNAIYTVQVKKKAKLIGA